MASVYKRIIFLNVIALVGGQDCCVMWPMCPAVQQQQVRVSIRQNFVCMMVNVRILVIHTGVFALQVIQGRIVNTKLKNVIRSPV